MEDKPRDIVFGSNFLDMTPKAQATKEKQKNGTPLSLKLQNHNGNNSEKATHR